MKRMRTTIAMATAALLGACGVFDDDEPEVIEVRTQPTPLAVALPAAATEVGAGWAHTCAVLAGGALNCWGGNQAGQLGNGGAGVPCVEGYSVCSNGPVAVSGTTVWTRVAGGYLYTCAIDNAGAARCWGAGRRGQLGDGNLAGSSVPVAVAGGLTFSQLSGAMGGDLACGIAGGNALYCWGTGYYGQSGIGGYGQTAATPYRVGPAQSFTAVAVGEIHACALDNAGLAHCWGSNYYGQVGDGTRVDRGVPTVTLGGRSYTQIVAGLAHTCALDAAGVAYCWGAGGQIGRASSTSADRSVPTAVDGAQRFVQIAAGGWHTCGIDTGGALWCWGDNTYAQFGDGGGAASLSPRAIAGMPPFVQITAGGAHTCGRTAAGAVHCWGANTYGQSGRLP
ncbi:MAG TPA: hypothetical protein VNK91_15810 [Burkholderiaceae bacterium]|jgi:alpha-tubulin suppressor-like RCC1 family protein|nr:hypothetical protein [Burkholderiaceae bacterium]